MIIKSKCPECGARMKVDMQAEFARCEYCGTTARIADKKKPPPKPTPHAPKAPEPVIWVSTGRSFAWTWIFSALLPLAIFGFVFYTTASKTPLGNMFGLGDGKSSGPGSGSSVGQSFGEHMQWVSHKQPMLADLTGDGVLDVIGWTRFLNMGGGTTYDHLGAFDPVKQQRIWDTGPLGDSSNTSKMRAAMIADKLLVADAGGMLKAYSLANGALVWQAIIGERTEAVCAAEQGFADVRTADKRISKINLANGQLTPAGQWSSDTPCGALQSDSEKIGPFFSFEDARDIDESGVSGIDIDSLVTDTSTGNVTALGTRKPGTRSPVAAGVQLTPGKRRRKVAARWISSVTTLNPLTVDEGAPDVAGAAVGRTVIAYDMDGSKAGSRLSCLDQNSGAVLWDVSIPRSDTGSIDRITVSSHHVFVGHWTYLDVFQLADGAHTMTVGIW